MRVLFLLSEFSGLEMIVKKKVWKPTGVPTIYRVIENVNKNYFLKVIILSKKKSGSINVKGLKSDFIFIKKFGLIKSITFLINIIKIYNEIKKNKIDVLYVDRSNLIYASIFSRVFKIRVILRIMGIYPDMLDLKKRRNVSSYLQRFFYLSPFSYVICTEDGSPGSWWLKNHLKKNVKRILLLGGYDNSQVKKIYNKSFKSTLNVLFIGRLEKWKGCLEFLDAALKLLTNAKRNFFFTIVGKGSLEKYVLNRIQTSQYRNKFLLIKNVENKKIYQLYEDSHVYVSLNKLGSLSNSNIEALSFGKCCIFLNSDNSSKVDLSTDKIIPKDCVIRISRKNTVEDLVKKLLNLHKNPKIIFKYEKKINTVFKNKFLSWNERIKIEENIIEEVFKS